MTQGRHTDSYNQTQMMQKIVTLATTVHCLHILCKGPKGVAAIGSGGHSIGNFRGLGGVGGGKGVSTAAVLFSTAKLTTSSSVKETTSRACASKLVDGMSSSADEIPQSVQETVNAVLQVGRCLIFLFQEGFS